MLAHFWILINQFLTAIILGSTNSKAGPNRRWKWCCYWHILYRWACFVFTVFHFSHDLVAAVDTRPFCPSLLVQGFFVYVLNRTTHTSETEINKPKGTVFFSWTVSASVCTGVYIYISLTLKKKCSLDVFLHFFYFKGIVLKSCHEKIWKDKSLSHFSETKKCYSNYFSLVMKSAVENWLSRKNLQTLNEENAALRKTLTGERNSKRFNVIQLLWK